MTLLQGTRDRVATPTAHEEDWQQDSHGAGFQRLSAVREIYGRQQGTAYNGHFECQCYQLLFFFSQFGDLESVLLRRGNKTGAKFWRRLLLPVLARYRHLSIPKFFCGDAAFAIPGPISGNVGARKRIAGLGWIWLFIMTLYAANFPAGEFNSISENASYEVDEPSANSSLRNHRRVDRGRSL